MTSTVSNKETKRISPFLHNMLCGISSREKMAIIIGILHIVAAPAAIIAAIVAIYSKKSVDSVSVFLFTGSITTAVAGFLGIFIAIDSFSCLHTKSVVDMRLSLPLTATQRFFSNFLAGLAVYIGPFLAAQVLSLLGMTYGFLFMDGKTFLAPAGYRDGKTIYREYVCEVFHEAFPVLLKLILCGVLAMLMLYTLTTLVTVCCGNKFESIAYTLLINVMIPLTIYLVFESMFMGLYGVDYAMSEVITRLMMYTSPAGGIMAALDWASDEYGVFGANMNFAVWVVVYVLLTAAMAAASFFLYRKRRAEQVSKPFVFKLIYYIISSAAVFCAYSAFYMENAELAPAVLTTLIMYIIFEYAANRGFKKIWLSFIKYIGVMGASVLIVFAAHKTEGFGMVTRVPDISAVKSVEFDYSGFYGTLYNYNINNALTFTEKENIETIIAAHRSRVDTRDEAFSWGAGVSGVRIVYHLKNGGRLVRRYDRFAPLQTEILGRIDLSSEYKTQLAESYRNLIIESRELFYDQTKYNYGYADDSYVNFNSIFSRTTNDYDHYKGIKTAVLAENGFFERLAEAYAADILNISEENYYQSSAKNYRRLYFVGTYVWVPDTFENTLAVLENYGFDIFYKEKLSDAEAYRLLEEFAESGSIYILPAEQWREVNKVPDGVRLHASYEANSFMQIGRVETVDEDLCDIFREAEIMNIVPENGYIIKVLGETMAVPEKLNGAAERVYAGSVKDDAKRESL